jgi:hypothetical protein
MGAGRLFREGEKPDHAASRLIMSKLEAQFSWCGILEFSGRPQTTLYAHIQGPAAVY